MEKVIKPWGYYQVLYGDKNCQIKLISILSRAAPSYQSHKFRSEVWTITQGKGVVTLNDMIFTVETGQIVKVLAGDKHRIRNLGEIDLEFIEIQQGESFSELDISRYEDDYNRL